MKQINCFLWLMIIVFTFSSCITNKVVSENFIQKRKYKKGFYVSKRDKKSKQFDITEKQKELKQKEYKLNDISTNNFDLSEYEITASAVNSFQSFNKTKDAVLYNNISIKDNPDSCDILIMIDGSEISAKVSEIGIDLIKYKDCKNLNGPTIAVRKSDVFFVKYPNGTKTVITKFVSQSEPYLIKRKTEGTAIVSFLLSILGFFIFGIIFGTVSVILGIVGLNIILKNPDKWKGKGFAIAGICIGFVDVVALLILLSSF